MLSSATSRSSVLWRSAASSGSISESCGVAVPGSRVGGLGVDEGVAGDDCTTVGDGSVVAIIAAVAGSGVAGSAVGALVAWVDIGAALGAPHAVMATASALSTNICDHRRPRKKPCTTYSPNDAR